MLRDILQIDILVWDILQRDNLLRNALLRDVLLRGRCPGLSSMTALVLLVLRLESPTRVESLVLLCSGIGYLEPF